MSISLLVPSHRLLPHVGHLWELHGLLHGHLHGHLHGRRHHVLRVALGFELLPKRFGTSRRETCGLPHEVWLVRALLFHGVPLAPALGWHDGTVDACVAPSHGI